MTTASDKLFLELDAEFGKGAKRKSAPGANDERAALNKGFHERIDGSKNPLRGANEYARSWREDPSFEPVKRIVYVHLQVCKSCGHAVQYVANQFTEFESKRLRARVKSAETVTHDSLGFELPILLEQHCIDVEECVDCLVLGQKVAQLIDVALTPEPGIAQFDLFGGSHARH